MNQRLSDSALEEIQQPTLIFCQDCKYQCKSLVIDTRFEEGVVERCSCSLNYFNLGKDDQYCSLGERK